MEFFIFSLVYVEYRIDLFFKGIYLKDDTISALRVPPGGNQVDGLPPAQHFGRFREGANLGGLGRTRADQGELGRTRANQSERGRHRSDQDGPGRTRANQGGLGQTGKTMQVRAN